MIRVVKVVHVQLKVHHVGLLEKHSVPGGEAAAHCVDHFGSSMASRTRQPRERKQKGEKGREEGRGQRKREQKGERKEGGGRGRGGHARVS